nr:response regulator [uncultured Duganella sp.]
MLLRTQLKWLLTVMLLSMAASIVTLYYSQAQLARHGRDAVEVKALIRDISDLRFILTESVLFREQRATRLWQSKLKSMRSQRLLFAYSLAEQNALKAGILKETASAVQLHEKLTRIPTSAAVISSISDEERELRARVVAALLVSTQEMLDDATSIGSLNDEEISRLLELRQQYSIAGLVLLAIFASLFAGFLQRWVLRPLHQFQRAAELVGGGNLHHRVALNRQNEFGMLANAFNGMTTELQQTIHALQRKIEDYDQAQSELQRHATKLADDIAARKLVEVALEQARMEAESSNRAKDAFIANMSHELRTPLNAVLGATQLLSHSLLTATQSEYLDVIDSSSASLLAVLNAILDYSSLEAGGITIESMPIELAPLFEAVAESMAAGLGNKPVDLSIGVAPEVPLVIVGDAQRLQQVLVQLVGNAIKFTERGEVRLQVSTRRDDGKMVIQFAVHDTGIGIADAQRDRMFTPFMQADSSSTRRYGGVGLGLAISHRLVGLMGGCLRLESTSVQGSVISLLLPCSMSTLTPDESSVTLPQRMLLVDSHPGSLTMLSLSFSGPRWQTDACSSSAQAVNQLNQSAQTYDVLLVAADLPHREHLEQALSVMRQSLKRPVIWMVGSGDEPRARDVQPRILKPLTTGAVTALLTEKAPVAAAPTRAELPPLRVLLTEDNPMNQFVGRRMLEQLGVAVNVAVDGAQACAMLQAEGHDYDLVLMDIHMPVMDGFEATRMIRSELKLKLPVVAMTAGVTEYERARCLNAGMDDFLSKPVTLERLQDTLTKYTGRQSDLLTELTAPKPTAGSLEILYIIPVATMCEGKPVQHNILLSMVNQLVAEADGELANARDHWRKGQSILAARSLHSLRGALSSIGAQQFSVAALRLEQALQQKAGDEIANLFENAGHTLTLTLEAARRWMATQQTASLTEQVELNTALLARWTALLESQDMEAYEVYEQVKTMLSSLLSQRACEQLQQAMQRFDFMAALACLEPLDASIKATDRTRG